MKRQAYHRLVGLPRSRKRMLLLLADLLSLPLCLWLAVALRHGHPFPAALPAPWVFVTVTALSLPAFHAFGIYRSVLRALAVPFLLTIAAATMCSALLLVVAGLLPTPPDLDATVPAIFWMTLMLAMVGVRAVARLLLEFLGREIGDKEPIGIYGAGQGGVQSVAALKLGPEYNPVFLIDDDPALWGTIVNGIPVWAPDALPDLIPRYGVGRVLLAMPSAGRARRREIVERLETSPVRIMTMPGLADLVSGAAQIDEMKEIEIEDLLGRDPVPPIRDLLERNIRGKSVLVSGAGGSIGSELCRQIAQNGPARIVLLDLSEYALYAIEEEIRRAVATAGHDTEVVALLGSAARKRRMTHIMRHFAVHTVYHAGAYKHVPLVEQNIVECVRNNIFTTWHLAEAAIESGVETFVLISTDKAVRPTNVMGASKRMAELILQGLAREEATTRFTMVRFGNVLGSSGSVVPRFREQIRAGGPVTVTRPDITRYFMTISEAAGLVLQAGAMGTGGDVFLLEMGEPVRVVDLARRMIRLMGLKIRDADDPKGDIAIEFIGLRPGEKLYEELLIGNDTSGTTHPRIMRAEETSLAWTEIVRLLRALDDACAVVDIDAIRQLLAEVVQGYQTDTPTVDPMGLIGPSVDHLGQAGSESIH